VIVDADGISIAILAFASGRPVSPSYTSPDMKPRPLVEAGV